MVIVLFYFIIVRKYVDIETTYFSSCQRFNTGFIRRKQALLDIEYENVTLLVALYTSCLKSW